uniref:Uncharacterized protein n=1 Tax=Brassica oleracea var. oleracea TaxID=109376 RepID=A0A0D3B326_BRAOL
MKSLAFSLLRTVLDDPGATSQSDLPRSLPIQSDPLERHTKVARDLSPGDTKNRPWSDFPERHLQVAPLRSDLSQRHSEVAPEVWSDYSERRAEVARVFITRKRENESGATSRSDTARSLPKCGATTRSDERRSLAFSSLGNARTSPERPLAATQRGRSRSVERLLGATSGGRSRFHHSETRERVRSDLSQRHSEVAPEVWSDYSERRAESIPNASSELATQKLINRHFPPKSSILDHPRSNPYAHEFSFPLVKKCFDIPQNWFDNHYTTTFVLGALKTPNIIFSIILFRSSQHFEMLISVGFSFTYSSLTLLKQSTVWPM